MDILIKKDTISQIADAIRLTRGNGSYSVSKMPDAMREAMLEVYSANSNELLCNLIEENLPSDFELPKHTTCIGGYARIGTGATSITIPASVKLIERYAFSSYSFETVTFKGTPNSISSSAFGLNHNSRIKTINVPWSEGEVANAPWGATNATINYNYTGE
jgi:hypothetical protein